MEIHGVDMSVGLHHCSESEEIYSIVLKSVYMEGLETIELMKRAEIMGDYKKYEILMHGFKSIAASIGAIGLSHMAKLHELAAKEKNIEFIRENKELFFEQYEKLLLEISNNEKIMRSY
ncbi:MAG: hypothetical protein ACERKN_00670 [Velocimicrobium sp.]